MLSAVKLKMYQKLNDPAFLFYALNPITVFGFLLLAPVMLAAWLLRILFTPVVWLLDILFTPVVWFGWLLGKFAEFVGDVRRSSSNETYTDEDWLRDIKRREYNKGYHDGMVQ